MRQAEHLKATELYDLDRLTIQRQVICHGKLYELVGGNENCHDPAEDTAEEYEEEETVEETQEAAEEQAEETAYREPEFWPQ